MNVRAPVRNVATVAGDLLLVRRATRRFLRRAAAEELFYGTEILCRLAADIGSLPPQGLTAHENDPPPPLHDGGPLDD